MSLYQKKPQATQCTYNYHRNPLRPEHVAWEKRIAWVSYRMFWKGTVLESVVYILQNSSLCRILQNVSSQAAFWPFLLTSRSSEGPIIEKSIRRVVSPTAHPKAALSPWKMFSMFLKGSCRGLQKVKSDIMKHSLGHSRSLSVQEWHIVNWKKNHTKNPNPTFLY